MERLFSKGQRMRRAATPRTVVALMLREMATSYGRSPGGYLWAVAEPVAALALISAIFALVLHAPSLGTSFPLFYATGYLPFMMFNEVANKMATAIRFSKPLLAYPAVTYVDALLARLLLVSLTHLMVGYIIFIAILGLFETRAILDHATILRAYLVTALLAAGVGTFNCYLMTAFPAWERIWQIVTRPLFIVSCIFFIFEDVPRVGRDWLWFNPLVHVVGEMRRGFYANYRGDYISLTYVCAVSMVLLLVGLLLLYRHHRALTDY
ncbi:ABC transporter permease [Phaeovulum vinaykumarii]|uniref:Transport permease protein n=1 Tax=Phaeovulum vinaykumarii TaxID=407234 RepID=A0A1N7KD56_9RHOB|nr:ABC transporter permease [Phaeovulum vinaykumarii]SIS59528.1 capsular polysaccharide transport system permease protein [Phaeovulum vinaykumarii]SOB94142.1 capsular polysaccharide transport system permease protein [Phaeovulum vinaykumarii]